MKDMINEAHRAEAEERWGSTEEYRESTRRTASYSDEQWKKIRMELDDIEADFADAMTTGVPTDSDEASELAERARMHIDRWYYPCSHTMHASLAEMYTADARFKAHYDDRAEGLAEYVAGAIQANAARHG